MRRYLTPVCFVAGALLLAACGGGGSSASGSTTTTTTPGGAARNAAFTSCLKQYGVTLPAGAFGGFGGRRPTGASGASGGGFGGGGAGGRPPISVPGVSAQKLQAALGACRSKLPNGGRFGGGGGANAGAVKAYLSCLGDHGVTVPTTTSGSTPAGAGSQLRAVRNDPKYAAASKACAALLPTFGGSTTTTTPAG